MAACPSSLGSLYNEAQRVALPAPCRRWSCPPCGRYKARRVAQRMARVRPDFFVTLTAPPGFGWPTERNLAAFQAAWRVLQRWMHRHGLLQAFGWVREVGEARAECVCLKPAEAAAAGVPEVHDCECGAFGGRLHRHLLVRVSGPRNRYGRPWLPFEALWAAWQRAWAWPERVRVDVRPVEGAHGACAYLTKYLTKSIADGMPRRARRFATSERADEPEPGWAWSPYPAEYLRTRWLVGEAFDLATGEVLRGFDSG